MSLLKYRLSLLARNKKEGKKNNSSSQSELSQRRPGLGTWEAHHFLCFAFGLKQSLTSNKSNCFAPLVSAKPPKSHMFIFYKLCLFLILYAHDSFICQMACFADAVRLSLYPAFIFYFRVFCGASTFLYCIYFHSSFPGTFPPWIILYCLLLKL